MARLHLRLRVLVCSRFAIERPPTHIQQVIRHVHDPCLSSIRGPLRAFFQVTDRHSKDDHNLVKGLQSTRVGATPTMTITTFEVRGGRYAIQRLIRNKDWSEIQCVICFAAHAGWWRSFKKDMRRKSVLEGLLCLNWILYSSIRWWTASCGKKNKTSSAIFYGSFLLLFQFLLARSQLFIFSLFSSIKTSFITFSPSIRTPGPRPCFDISSPWALSIAVHSHFLLLSPLANNFDDSSTQKQKLLVP